MVLHSKEAPSEEIISSIYCAKDYPEIDSHHDIIISCVTIPVSSPLNDPHSAPAMVPRVDLPRYKFVWTDEGIANYEELVAPRLVECRSRWLNPSSSTCMSVLLHSTNNILVETAKATNKFIDLSKVQQLKSEKKPNEIKKSEETLKQAHRAFKSGGEVDHLGIRKARNQHRSVVRNMKVRKEIKQDENLFSALTSNPSQAFRTLRSAKSSHSVEVPFIKVGEKTFAGNSVVDGFFESISNLKTVDQALLEASPHHTSLMSDYENIKFLCANKVKLPPVSLTDSSKVLKRMKSSVSDLFSITANHFLFAGTSGLVHFNLLLNNFITDINNCSIEELNIVYALLLFKGHKKDRTLDTSYRTISTCPLLAKGLDMVVRDLSIEFWNNEQAETQYQGEGSSHELASLLVTEAIQKSKSNRESIFALFLDASSAFDGVIIPYLVRDLYLTGMDEQGVLYMNNRLSSRSTVLELDKIKVGPIHDEKGLEQGGLSSSDCYKLYNNECLKVMQKSGLGVKMGENLVVSCVGQADDTVLLANDVHNLHHLLQLCLQYCKKYCVQLSSSKTKLIKISADKIPNWVPYNPININGKNIEFVDQAEHVGVLRSVKGNMLNILERVKAFKGALGAIVSCGLARGRRTNPAASLRIVSLYGTPVLMS